MNKLPVSVSDVLPIALAAGTAILEVYHNPEVANLVKLKSDQSPLTLADEASNKIIEQELKNLTPNIPILSEEGADIPYEVRKNWEYYWCVDPLDGTKEFIHRNGEFTVNIALIYQQTPVLGVIYVPVTQMLYYGDSDNGSFKQVPTGQIIPLHMSTPPDNWIAIGSRSHAAPEDLAVLNKYPVTATITAGSSLKFCSVAEGNAHIYYRHGPTMEWDTAAGQAIVTNSGGLVTTPTGEPFLYNKPSLLNGSFLCKVR